MIKRPTAKESEDDLLRLQKEFSTDPSSKPSATLIKRGAANKNTKNEKRIFETVSASVFSEIREKNTDLTSFEFRPPKANSFSSSRAMPAKSATEFLSTNSSTTDDQGQDLESIKRQVHKENADQLAKMSQQEILEQRQELLKKLDPKLIEFLRSRKGQNTADEATEKTEEKSETKEGSLVDLPHLQESATAKLALDEFPIKPTKQWLHMDQPEPEKMAWMSSMPESTSAPQQDIYSARFDFKGHLVFRNRDVSVTAGLHHHGTEPEVAGYTIDELLRLCRVQALNQRVLALNTLANIVRLTKSGVYDNVLRPPLMKLLLDSSVCTIMRYALDDNGESVVVAAIGLLASFLHNSADEACLDISYGLSVDTSQLTFSPAENEDESEDASEEGEMDDEAFCKKDLILGLLRMETLQRLRYILEVLQPKSGRCVMDAFSILVRVARHSTDSCKKVFDCPRLMNTVTKQFLTATWGIEGPESAFYPSYNAPYWGAMKLCRIIASSNRDSALALIEKYRIDDVMIRYIMAEPEDLPMPLTEACQLIIESYRLWSQFLIHGLCVDYFTDLFEIMVKHLGAAISLAPNGRGRQFQWDRAAALALTIEKVAMISKKSDVFGGKIQLTGVVDVAIMSLRKTLQDAGADAHVSYYYLITSLANCCAATVTCNVPLDLKQLTMIVKDLVPKLQSSFGDRFTRESMPPTRNFVRLAERDPSCLPSLESIGGGGLIEMVRQGSLFPLFAALRRLNRAVDDANDKSDKE